MISVPASFPTATLIAVAGTLLGATITGLVSYFTTKKQQKHEDNRRVAEFYLEKKVEILVEFQSLVAKSHGYSLMGVTFPEEDIEEIGESRYWEDGGVEELTSALQQAGEMHESVFVYFNKHDRNQILGALSKMQEVRDLLEKEKKGQEIASEEYITIHEYEGAVREALEILRRELTKPIEKIEE